VKATFVGAWAHSPFKVMPIMCLFSSSPSSLLLLVFVVAVAAGVLKSERKSLTTLA
jgi:hypothetical protein